MKSRTSSPSKHVLIAWQALCAALMCCLVWTHQLCGFNFQTYLLEHELTLKATTMLSSSFSSSSGNIALFYNVFIPFPDGRGIDLVNQTMEIVAEQLDQIKHSYSAAPEKAGGKLTIYYNTIGNPKKALVKVMCAHAKLKCQHLWHFDQGNEEVTIHALWAHCQIAPENERVIYMHSKGSYHDNQYNQNWRKHLLKAVTSEMCVDRPLHDTCNVCGLQFYPFWTPMFPGNFFIAKCSYVRQLYPPLMFKDRLNETSTAMRANDAFLTTIFPTSDWTWGAGRQAAEHWIGSHPDLVPCDVSTSFAVYDWVKYGLPDYETSAAEAAAVAAGTKGAKKTPPVGAAPAMEYQMGPRHPPDVRRHMVRLKILNLILMKGNKTARDREYYLLGGLLTKYRSLYNTLPDQSSWVWDWFPDGEKWLERVEKMGLESVPAMGRAAVPAIT